MHRIVVLGSGKVTRKNAEALIGDLWDSISGDKRLVFPVEDAGAHPAAEHALAWATETLAPFEVYCAQPFEAPDALRVHVVEDPIKTVIDTLGVEDQILLAWEDEDRACYRTLTLATEAGVVCKDLTTGLMTLELDESDAEDPVSVTFPIEPIDSSPEPEEEDLPVTMPLRDDDLMTSLTVFAKALSDYVYSDVVARLKDDAQSPSKARTRAQKRQSEGSSV